MEFPNNSFAFGSNVAPTSSVMMQGLPPSFGNTMYQSVHSHVPNYHFTSTPATNSIYESSSQSLPFDVSAPASQSARRSSSNGDSQSAKDVKKPKRKQVKNACVNCQKACKKCDDGRPCQRCIKLGLTATCVDSPRKERKKGIKRGPYKKRQQQQQRPLSDSNLMKSEWCDGLAYRSSSTGYDPSSSLSTMSANVAMRDQNTQQQQQIFMTDDPNAMLFHMGATCNTWEQQSYYPAIPGQYTTSRRSQRSGSSDFSPASSLSSFKHNVNLHRQSSAAALRLAAARANQPASFHAPAMPVNHNSSSNSPLVAAVEGDMNKTFAQHYYPASPEGNNLVNSCSRSPSSASSMGMSPESPATPSPTTASSLPVAPTSVPSQATYYQPQMMQELLQDEKSFASVPPLMPTAAGNDSWQSLMFSTNPCF